MSLRVALLLSLSLLTLSSPPVSAAPLDWYQPVARASLTDQSSLADVERQYPLSAPRRISGRLRMEDALNASGQLTTRTWELPAGHPAGETFDSLREQLLAQGAQLLFWCEGRECGSSSLWLTRVFDQPRLVAPEDQQASLLVRLADSDSLVAVYAVTRGNRRSYLYLEQLDSRTPLPALSAGSETLLLQLRDTGELLLAGELAGEDDPRLDRLARLLQRDISMRVLLVSTQARQWRDALVARGVRQRQLDLQVTDGPQGGLLIQWLR